MKVSPWVVPILVVALTAGGVGLAQLFAIPTVEMDLAPGAEPPPGAVVLTLVVRGVRCADTARAAATSLEDMSGVFRYVAYASHGRVDITIDPALTNRKSLIEAIEGPVYDADSGEFLFGVFAVVEK